MCTTNQLHNNNLQLINKYFFILLLIKIITSLSTIIHTIIITYNRLLKRYLKLFNISTPLIVIIGFN